MKIITLFFVLLFLFTQQISAQLPWQKIETVEEVCTAYPAQIRSIFLNLDLGYPGLQEVKKAYESGNLTLACKNLLDYYSNSKKTRQDLPLSSEQSIMESDSILQDIYTFQRVTDKVPHLADGHLKWTCTGPEDDIEWAWALNRHYTTRTLLDAYFKTGNKKYVRYIDLFTKDWITSSWPYPAVKSSTALWRGLEVSFRAKVWSDVFFDLWNTHLISPATQLLILSSLPQHAHYARNFHAQGNWLTMEISGLGTIASSFPEYKESKAWMDYSIETMVASMKEQVYPDGVQSELTSSYHLVALSNFSLFADICSKNRVALPEYYTKTLEEMWNYLAQIMRPDGCGVLNNDADLINNREAILKEAEIYKRPDWIFIASNGKTGAAPKTGPSIVFPYAGQLISRSDYDVGAHWSFFDIGPWGSGHQHNDKLHLSVAAYGQDFLVDGGRFAYRGEVANKFRKYATGSASHNLILVDGKGQADGPRVTKEPLNQNEYLIARDFDYGSGQFDKFIGSQGLFSHTRSMVYVRGKFWVVADQLRTDRPRNIETLWHWHPGNKVSIEKSGRVGTQNGGANLQIIPVGTTDWKVTMVKGAEKPAIQGWYSKEYNQYEANPASIYSRELSADETFIWVLWPSAGKSPEIQTKLLSKDGSSVRILVTEPGQGSWEIEVPVMNSKAARVSFTKSKAGYPTDLSQLHQNILNELLNWIPGKDSPLDLCNKLNEQGGWPDIDYTSKQRGSWEPARHLGNVQTLSKAWNRVGSDSYHDPKILKAIHKALNYWLENDFQCPNWWYPEIGVPMSLAPTLILMEDELSEEQLAKGVKILDRAKIGMTGQNKVWLSGNVLMKSLLLRNSVMIRKATQSIQEELRVSLGEGIQPDGSFHQHGPQIQFGNYGLSYVGDMIKWIRLLRQTPFAFDESKMEILRNYLTDGQQWITWKNHMDISACGRQLFVNAQEGKARSLSGSFRQMESLDPTNSKVYKNAGQFETLTGNKHFWRSDFQVQRTPEYYFSVKMCSERVIGAESCNSENIQGYYMGDGATYLYQSGKEYTDIFPFWDWKKIPGTTTQQDDKELPVLTSKGYRIVSDFVGGVSDGKTGIAVMDYNRDGVTAKKAWFTFNDQIVCLGAGITAATGLPVTTSVNQSFLNGTIVVKTTAEETIPSGTSASLTPEWILHDSIGYYFPAGAKLQLESKTVSGSWNQVASMYKYESISAPIFKLWFDHGINPDGQSYAYCLVPMATRQKMENLEKKPSFQILTNESNLQTVASQDLKWIGIVFYQAGKSTLLGGVEVDQPCVLLIRKEARGLTVSLSDPTQKLKSIRLKINGVYKSSDGSAVAQKDGKSEIIIALPSGNEAGKTVTKKLKG